jgi:hypothetical protein
MQICKNLILALASFSTASSLWTPPDRPERVGIEGNSVPSSLRDAKLPYLVKSVYKIRGMKNLQLSFCVVAYTDV